MTLHFATIFPDLNINYSQLITLTNSHGICMYILYLAEKQQITKFFSTITGRLRKCDRKLASVKFLHDLTRRGLAVHHSGMLPILKEVSNSFAV